MRRLTRPRSIGLDSRGDLMKVGFLRSGFLAAVLCTAWGYADAAFTYVQLFCQGGGFQEVINSSGGPASDTCMDSGRITIGIDGGGTFTSAAGGNADFGGGNLAAAVTYTHLVETGVSVGPTATAGVGAFDRLSGFDPMVESFWTWGLNRLFGSGADPGITAVPTISFVVALGDSICELADTGFCTVTKFFGVTDAIFAWGAISTASVSGSGSLGSGFAFDPGTIGLQSVTFRDSAGNLVSSSFQSDSGFDYLAAVAPPIPEPETWALMLAGLGSLVMVSRRRRRAR